MSCQFKWFAFFTLCVFAGITVGVLIIAKLMHEYWRSGQNPPGGSSTAWKLILARFRDRSVRSSFGGGAGNADSSCSLHTSMVPPALAAHS